MTRNVNRRICAVPGCGRILYAKNTMQVCRKHNHAPGLCACLQCKGPPEPRYQATQARKTVEIPYATCNSVAAGRVKVTLSRPPWEEE
jgi:hypothetical protein